MRAVALVGLIALLSTNAGAQSLDCVAVDGQNSTGLNFEVAAPPPGTAPPSGYIVVGGSCDVRPPGRESRALLRFAGVEGDRYVCRVEAIDREQSPTTVFAKASAIACRVTAHAVTPTPIPHQPRRALVSNWGLGGNTVVAAINGREVTAALPVDYRICNTAGGAPLGVDVAPDRSLPLRFGACLDLPAPRGLAFRTSDTVVVDEAGYYRPFAKGTFKNTARRRHFKPSDEDKLDQSQTTRVFIGKAAFFAADCFAKAQPGAPLLDQSWKGYCALDAIKPDKNYRLCFEKGYTGQGDGRLEYPGSLLPLVLDRTLMNKPQSDNYVGLNYQALTYGCRDIFDAQEAYILIAFANWNDQKVERIAYSLAEIQIVH